MLNDRPALTTILGHDYGDRRAHVPFPLVGRQSPNGRQENLAHVSSTLMKSETILAHLVQQWVDMVVGTCRVFLVLDRDNGG